MQHLTFLKSVCRSLDDSRFIESEAALQWSTDWEVEVNSQADISATEKTRRLISQKTRFDIRSMVKGFQSYCRIILELFPGAHIIASRTSQDYVELFFAQQGQNNNPTEWQYGMYVGYL